MACRWVQDKNTCPICRKPLDQAAAPPPKMAEQQQQQRQRTGLFAQDMIATEMAFRLTNLQRCACCLYHRTYSSCCRH